MAAFDSPTTTLIAAVSMDCFELPILLDSGDLRLKINFQAHRESLLKQAAVAEVGGDRLELPAVLPPPGAVEEDDRESYGMTEDAIAKMKDIHETIRAYA